MPTYTIRDPKSGKTVKLTGDSPPTAGELEQIFASVPPADGQTFMGNVARNAGEVASGLVQTVLHPIDTAMAANQETKRMGKELAAQPEPTAQDVARESAAGGGFGGQVRRLGTDLYERPVEAALVAALPIMPLAAKAGARVVAGSRAPAVVRAVGQDVIGRRFPATRRALRTAKAATAEPPPNPNAGGRLVGKPPAEPSIEQVITEALTANEQVGRTLPDTTGSPSVTMSPRVREVLKKQGQSPRAGTPGSQTPRAQGGGLSLGPAAKSRYLELSRKVILEPAEELELAHWHRLFKQAASESGTYYAAVGKKAK